MQAPVVQSLGYVSGLVTFGTRATPPVPVVIDDEVTINNGTLAITVSQSNLWAITSIMLGETEVLPSGTAANVIQIYDDTGNLYQYGNELGIENFTLRTSGLTAGKAIQTESGPLRWRVEAEVIGTGGFNYLIAYTLIAGESLVRMSVTGSAPPSTTVVTTIPAIATDQTTPGTHLIYGTAHHFHEDLVTAYWQGPMFKATHDFLMPAADSPAQPSPWPQSTTAVCPPGPANRAC